ncbi:hypothetical protein HMI55_003847 [Coelomomyces lativittatus]|nr:hypothetical protein HMI55_003847 [Coelomomyces lativittatus]
MGKQKHSGKKKVSLSNPRHQNKNTKTKQHPPPPPHNIEVIKEKKDSTSSTTPSPPTPTSSILTKTSTNTNTTNPGRDLTHPTNNVHFSSTPLLPFQKEVDTPLPTTHLFYPTTVTTPEISFSSDSLSSKVSELCSNPSSSLQSENHYSTPLSQVFQEDKNHNIVSKEKNEEK